MSQDKEELVAQLNKETAKLGWNELEKHFARGSVIKVNQGLDLIDIAALFANDDAKAIEDMLENGDVSHPDMSDAKIWNECNSVFWAVVVAPFVLVQEIKPKLNS